MSLSHTIRSVAHDARAWAIKELSRDLWHYKRRAWARRAWLRWYSWAIRSRLDPVKQVARMVKKRHLEGILNAVVLGVTTARSETINAKIQWIKYTARGPGEGASNPTPTLHTSLTH